MGWLDVHWETQGHLELATGGTTTVEQNRQSICPRFGSLLSSGSSRRRRASHLPFVQAEKSKAQCCASDVTAAIVL
jgi:hypothetical protein